MVRVSMVSIGVRVRGKVRFMVWVRGGMSGRVNVQGEMSNTRSLTCRCRGVGSRQIAENLKY